MKNSHAHRCSLCIATKAREYLAQFRFNGKSISFVELANGTRLEIAHMTDSDAVNVAHQLYEMEKPKRGTEQ